MATTNVPAAQWTAGGLIVPTDAAVLAGIQADVSAAFGGGVNPLLTTPQGQIATSLTAIVGYKNQDLLAVVNGMDPALNSGRMQDAIARLFGLTRLPAVASTVSALCTGVVGTIIPIGAIATDGVNLWTCTQAGTIPIGGSVTLSFACAVTGPIACGANVVNQIFQAIPGWTGINNPALGVLGSVVENRSTFELRRQATLMANSMASVATISGAVLKVPGVTDVITFDNSNGYTTSKNPTAVIVGTISGTTLTVGSVTSGTVAIGQTVGLAADGVAGVTLPPGITIVSGTGPYTLSAAATVPVGTIINLGGTLINPNTVYVCVAPGTATNLAVATAIWSKKIPGCGYTGATSATVLDQSSGYNAPYPTYTVSFQTAAALPILFGVSIPNTVQVPANYLTLIQNALINAFAGGDGGPKARIASTIYASRFVTAVTALGPWAQVISLQIGISSANLASVLVPANQVPTLIAGNITVSLI